MADNVWTAGVARQYWRALDQIEQGLRLCPDELWEASIWPVERHHPWVWPIRRAGEKEHGDEAAMLGLLPRVSAFWNVAYHAIFYVDFYLARGVLKGYRAPKPFQEADHRGNTVPARVYTRDELLGYVAYCRERVRDVVLPLTEAQAAEVVPRVGAPFAEFLVNNIAHTREHAAQLSLFLSQQGIEPPEGIAAVGMRQALVDGVRGRDDEGIDAFAAVVGGYDRLLPMVFAGLCARLRPASDVVVRFDVGSGYVVRARAGKASVEKKAPKAVDATVRMTSQEFLRWMVGEVAFEDAVADGRALVEGDGVVEGLIRSANV